MSEINRRAVLLAGGMAVAAATAMATPAGSARAEVPPTVDQVGGPDPAAPELKVVKVSDLGFNKSDSTEFLQAALDSDADVVVIDKRATHWVTRPLFLRRSDVTILLEQGAVVRAMPGGFPSTSQAMLTIQDVANVTVSGYGATMVMNKPEYVSGEWRHVLNLKTVTNVLVEGLVLRDSGGDGLYLGMTAPGKYSREVVVRDVTCLNNRRNGISVIAADGLLIEGCNIRQTSGTGPDAGIDFEPNNASSVFKRVLVRDTAIEDNMIYSVVLALGKLDATSQPVDITFERVLIGANNSQTPAFTYKGSANGDPGGTVTLRQCLVAKERATGAAGSTDIGYLYGGQAPGHLVGTAMGVLGIFAKPAAGTRVVLEDTVLWDRNNPHQYFHPIAVSPMTLSFTGTSNYPVVNSAFGGVQFDNCALVTDAEDHFLAVAHEHADSPGVSGLTGRLVVVDRNPVTADLGRRPSGNSLQVEYERSRSAPDVALAVDRTTAAPGDTVTLTITRTSGRLDIPVAVRYVAGGTVDGYPGAKQPAVLGLDVTGLSGVAVIPAGQRSIRIPVASRAVAGRTGARHLTVALQSGHGYELAATSRDRIAVVVFQ